MNNIMKLESMKKILFIVITTMIISSCNTEKPKTTFIVKFKDNTEMKVVGTNVSDSRGCIYLYHKDNQASVFVKDEILYILKEQ